MFSHLVVPVIDHILPLKPKLLWLMYVWPLVRIFYYSPCPLSQHTPMLLTEPYIFLHLFWKLLYFFETPICNLLASFFLVAPPNFKSYFCEKTQVFPSLLSSIGLIPCYVWLPYRKLDHQSPLSKKSDNILKPESDQKIYLPPFLVPN